MAKKKAKYACIHTLISYKDGERIEEDVIIENTKEAKIEYLKKEQERIKDYCCYNFYDFERMIEKFKKSKNNWFVFNQAIEMILYIESK